MKSIYDLWTAQFPLMNVIRNYLLVLLSLPYTVLNAIWYHRVIYIALTRLDPVTISSSAFQLESLIMNKKRQVVFILIRMFVNHL